MVWGTPWGQLPSGVRERERGLGGEERYVVCVLGGVNEERRVVGTQEEMPHCSPAPWRIRVERIC